jgi:hypothetical protein
MTLVLYHTRAQPKRTNIPICRDYCDTPGQPATRRPWRWHRCRRVGPASAGEGRPGHQTPGTERHQMPGVLTPPGAGASSRRQMSAAEVPAGASGSWRRTAAGRRRPVKSGRVIGVAPKRHRALAGARPGHQFPGAVPPPGTRWEPAWPLWRRAAAPRPRWSSECCPTQRRPRVPRGYPAWPVPGGFPRSAALLVCPARWVTAWSLAAPGSACRRAGGVRCAATISGRLTERRRPSIPMRGSLPAWCWWAG